MMLYQSLNLEIPLTLIKKWTLEDGKNNRKLYFNLSEKPEAKYMFIVSTRDIEPGEELVADYTLYSFN